MGEGGREGEREGGGGRERESLHVLIIITNLPVQALDI